MQMQRHTRRILAGLLAATLGLAALGHAQAQTGDYPNKPIRFLLSSSAGSGGDILGRYLAEKMAPLLKGTIYIENKPGAAGIIGTDATAKAAPDGYTLTLGGASTHMLSAALHPKLPYDPVKDFATIGQVGTAAILLIANNDYPVNNLKDVIALAKAKPDALQYASWGNGSTGQFCGEVLNQMAGIKISHVPYKTVPQVLNDVAAGHIKLGFVDMTSGTAFVKSGKAKAVSTCTSRSPSLPEVRSYIDEGIDFNRIFRWGLYAPAGTPKPIVDKLALALSTVLAMPEVKARLMDFGISADFAPGEELAATTARDIVAWKKVVAAAGIKAD
jgi:tripartite-type tricarboxylate transporter receptor subunit TctC